MLSGRLRARTCNSGASWSCCNDVILQSTSSFRARVSRCWTPTPSGDSGRTIRSAVTTVCTWPWRGGASRFSEKWKPPSEIKVLHFLLLITHVTVTATKYTLHKVHNKLFSVEQCLSSPPTQYRLSGRQFYRSKDPTNSIQIPKEKLFSEESCSAIGLSEKVGFQLGSELSATVERWADFRWKCVQDDWSRDGETSLADGRLRPPNKQVTATSGQLVDVLSHFILFVAR